MDGWMEWSKTPVARRVTAWPGVTSPDNPGHMTPSPAKQAAAARARRLQYRSTHSPSLLPPTTVYSLRLAPASSQFPSRTGPATSYRELHPNLHVVAGSQSLASPPLVVVMPRRGEVAPPKAAAAAAAAAAGDVALEMGGAAGGGGERASSERQAAGTWAAAAGVAGVGLAGAGVLVWWAVAFHPSHQQLWMVPVGLVLLGTPLVAWLSLFASGAGRWLGRLRAAAAAAGDDGRRPPVGAPAVVPER